MQRIFKVFRAFVDTLRRQETVIPLEQQPVKVTVPPTISPEQELIEYTQARRFRHGTKPVYVIKLTNTYRFSEYVIGDPKNVYVPPGQTLSYEAWVIDKKGNRYEIAGQFRSGEQWSSRRQNQKFAADLYTRNPDIGKASDIVKEATIEINWYLNKWVPENALLPI